jgi:hypothetical protein
VSIAVLNLFLPLANSSFMPAKILKMNPSAAKIANPRETRHSTALVWKPPRRVPLVVKKPPCPSSLPKAGQYFAVIVSQKRVRVCLFYSYGKQKKPRNMCGAFFFVAGTGYPIPKL